MEKASASAKRSLFAFDLPRPWAEALREVSKKFYPDMPSPTSLVRYLVQEFVGCHYTEEEMKTHGLLPFYKSQGSPELLKAAIRTYDNRGNHPKKAK